MMLPCLVTNNQISEEEFDIKADTFFRLKGHFPLDVHETSNNSKEKNAQTIIYILHD